MADFFDKMIVGVNKGVASISEGSKNLVEKAKLNSDIHTMEEEKNKLAQLMGLQVYNLYLAERELPEEILNFCMEMKRRDDRIGELKQSLAALESKNQFTPPVAGQYAPPAAPAGAKICSCGFANKPEAVFCANCGSRME